MRLLLLMLAAAATAPAACVLQDLTPGSTVEGTLSADCPVTELIPGSRSATYAAGYRVRVSAPTVLTARMTSTAVNPYLYVYSQASTALAANDDADGTTNSRITISLNPGVYTIVATTRNVAAGVFTLSTSTEEPRPCPVLDASSGATASGSLAEAGCRRLDLSAPSTDDRPVDRYRLAVSGKNVLTFEMRSPDFDTYLELWNAEGRRMVTDHAGAGNQVSRLVSSVQPGTYTVYAYPYRKATGTYSISASAEAPRACPVKPITAGSPDQPATASGAFTRESCRILDLVTPSSDATYVEPYRLTLAKSAIVSVKQQSTAIDSYLAITDPSYQSIFENEDEDDNTANAAIYGSLSAGTYIVLATESEQAAGAYSLSVGTEDPRPCPARDIAAGETSSASLQADSCRWLDVMMESEDTSYVAPYRMTLARRSVVTVDMKSPGLDTYLVITTPTYRGLFENDDADDDTTDSRIVGSLEAGTYTILATTYEPSAGSYTASLTVENPRPCPVKEIGRADSVTGTLTAQGCRYLDVNVPSDDPTPLDIYKVTADARGVLSLEMTATGFSPYLALTDGDYESYYDIDGEKEIKVDLLVPSGTYFVFANSMDTGGDYTLKTRFGPARDCPARSIGPQDTQRGSLTQGGCRFSDFVPFSDLTVPANQHRITLTERGTLRVKASSADFAPVVLVADTSNADFAALDLNAGGSPTAETSATLPAGSYNVVVLALVSGGAYEVNTTFTRSAATQ